MDIMSTLINAIVGMSVVFAVLIVLMLFISVMSKLMKKEEAPAPAAASAAPAQAPMAARGSCGEVKLFDVPDKTAAQLMAITADKLGKPLNTLRFVSIKEVK